MKKGRFIKLTAWLLIISLFFSGCSYTKFEENIRNNFLKEKVDTVSIIQGTVIEDPNSRSESNMADKNNEEISTKKDTSETDEKIIDTGFGDEATVKGIGETYYAYLKSNEYDKDVYRGYEGVSITLDSVKIYDNFYDAGVETNEFIINADGSISPGKQFLLDNASFILVQLTAVYNKPENGKSEILFSKELTAIYQEDPINPVNNHNGTQEDIIVQPITGWMNDLPTGDDERIDQTHNRDCVILNDGIPYTYQLGIFADQYFIENENVYLMAYYVPFKSIEGFRHKYFDISKEG